MKSLAPAGPAEAALDVLSHFRVQFYDCLYKRADALFDLTDAVLCADGPVTSPAELTLTAEHWRGHGAMYDAVNHGWLEPRRLRRLLAATPLPRAADGRIVLAADVSNWLRHDAPTSPDLLFCHVYGRGRSADQFIPGWPYKKQGRRRPDQGFAPASAPASGHGTRPVSCGTAAPSWATVARSAPIAHPRQPWVAARNCPSAPGTLVSSEVPSLLATG